MSTARLASHLRRKLASSGRYAFTQRLGFATAGSKIKEIVTEREFDTLVQEETRPIVVKFTAAWCPPCKAIQPVLEDLAGRHADVAFAQVDIDNGAVTPIVAEFGVAAVPTFVSLKGGKKLATFSGADRAQLKHMVEELSHA